MSMKTEMSAECKELLKEKCIVMGGGVPMFLQDGGEEKLNARRKELEVFCKILTDAPCFLLPKIATTINPASTSAAKMWWKNKETENAV